MPFEQWPALLLLWYTTSSTHLTIRGLLSTSSKPGTMHTSWQGIAATSPRSRRHHIHLMSGTTTHTSSQQGTTTHTSRKGITVSQSTTARNHHVHLRARITAHTSSQQVTVMHTSWKGITVSQYHTATTLYRCLAKFYLKGEQTSIDRNWSLHYLTPKNGLVVHPQAQRVAMHGGADSWIGCYLYSRCSYISRSLIRRISIPFRLPSVWFQVAAHWPNLDPFPVWRPSTLSRSLPCMCCWTTWVKAACNNYIMLYYFRSAEPFLIPY